MIYGTATSSDSTDRNLIYDLTIGGATDYWFKTFPTSAVDHTFICPCYGMTGIAVPGDGARKAILGMYGAGGSGGREALRFETRSTDSGFNLWFRTTSDTFGVCTVTWSALGIDDIGDLEGQPFFLVGRMTATSTWNFSVVIPAGVGDVRIASDSTAGAGTIDVPDTLYIGNQPSVGSGVVHQLRRIACGGLYVHNDAMTDQELIDLLDTLDPAAWHLGVNGTGSTLVFGLGRMVRTNAIDTYAHGVGGGTLDIDDMWVYDVDQSGGTVDSALTNWVTGNPGDAHWTKGAACTDANVQILSPFDCGFNQASSSYAGTLPTITERATRSTKLYNSLAGTTRSTTAQYVVSSNSRELNGQAGQDGYAYRGDGDDADWFNTTGLTRTSDYQTYATSALRGAWSVGWCNALRNADDSYAVKGYGSTPQASFNTQEPFFCRSFGGSTWRSASTVVTLSGLDSGDYTDGVGSSHMAKEFARLVPGGQAVYIPSGESFRMSFGNMLAMQPGNSKKVQVYLLKAAQMGSAVIKRGCVTGSGTINTVTASSTVDLSMTSTSRTVSAYTATDLENGQLVVADGGNDSVAEDLGFASEAASGLAVIVDKAANSYLGFSIIDEASDYSGGTETFELGRSIGGPAHTNTNITPQSADTAYFSQWDIHMEEVEFSSSDWGTFNAGTGVVENNWPLVEVAASSGPVIVLYRVVEDTSAQGDVIHSFGEGGVDYGSWWNAEEGRYFTSDATASTVNGKTAVARMFELLGIDAHLMHAAQNNGDYAGVGEVADVVRKGVPDLPILFIPDPAHGGSGSTLDTTNDNNVAYHQGVSALAASKNIGIAPLNPISIYTQYANGFAEDTQHYRTEGAINLVKGFILPTIAASESVQPSVLGGARALRVRSRGP